MQRYQVADCSVVEHQPQLNTATGGHRADRWVMTADFVWTACQTNGADLQSGSEEPYRSVNDRQLSPAWNQHAPGPSAVNMARALYRPAYIAYLRHPSKGSEARSWFEVTLKQTCLVSRSAVSEVVVFFHIFALYKWAFTYLLTHGIERVSKNAKIHAAIWTRTVVDDLATKIFLDSAITCSLKALVCRPLAFLTNQPLQSADADEPAVGRYDAFAVDASTVATDTALAGSTQGRHARPVSCRPTEDSHSHTALSPIKLWSRLMAKCCLVNAAVIVIAEVLRWCLAFD